jgi:sulfoxide reductase catalytic subunit YedY
MKTRRQIINILSRLLLFLPVFLTTGLTSVGRVFAKIKKRILSKDTDLQSVVNLNPAHLDTRHLPIMPLEAFGTMGDKDAPYQPDRWRLTCTGAVQTPVEFSYPEILKLPSIEREVLLLCPGVFANHGRWKGISGKKLTRLVQPHDRVSRILFYGRSRFEDRLDRYELNEFRSDVVFLAYAVNGQTLPRKHGFPLRVVAEGHYGMNWTKFVYKIEFE